MDQLDRTPYSNRAGDSGVRYFAAGPSYIRVWFKDGGCYEYDVNRPGPAHVEAMKCLAQEGRGLATFINRYVRANYARKL